MNPRLLACLYASILAGVLASGLALSAGWGWLVALGIYSLGGSLTLVVSTIAVAAGEPAKQRPVRVAARVPARRPA